MHLYVHVPFCARRCSYCDFAIAVRRSVPSGAYAETVLREWQACWNHHSWAGSPVIDTIYFGGGTPSLLATEELSRILDRIRADRPVAPDAELTLEANPDDITAVSARQWRAAGFNRVSLGAQSFDPAVLAWMHRTHRAEQISAGMAVLRAAGFTDLSLDLIFGLPAELERDWEQDLHRALALAPAHLSLYGLTVESHTPLAHWMRRGDTAPVEESVYAEEFLLADELLSLAGFEHYEVSNYARPGHRARHNTGYWRREPYLGLGPSAHSAFESERWWNLREWAAYEVAVRDGKPPMAAAEVVDPAARRLEDLYLGLRTLDGLSISDVPPGLTETWGEQGWIRRDGAPGRLALSPEGWLRMDALVGQVASHFPVIT